MNINTHVVTGVTGFVGSHLVVELIKRYPQDRIICIARGKTLREIKKRVLEKLWTAAWVSDINERIFDKFDFIDFVQCDLIKDEKFIFNFGIEYSRKIFWHAASSTNFIEKFKGELHDVNYNCMKKTVNFCLKHDFDEYNYISTAYVSGILEGGICNAIKSNQTYNNKYEETKSLAEQYLNNILNKNDVVLRIFRPSIICGHSITNRVSAEAGVLGFYEIFNKVPSENLSLQLGGANKLDVISIDQCTISMLDIYESSLGGVYHITAEEQIDTDKLIGVYNNCSNTKLTVVTNHENMTVVDKQVDHMISPYKPYYFLNRKFDQRKTSSLVDSSQYKNLDKISIHKIYKKFKDNSSKKYVFLPINNYLDKFSNKVFFKDLDGEYTYQEISNAVYNLSESFIQDDQLTSVLINKTDIASLVIFLACLNVGIDAYLLNPNCNDKFVNEVIDSNLITHGYGSIDRFPILPVKENVDTTFKPRSVGKFLEISEIKFALTSSGTTGKSKVIFHTFKDLMFMNTNYANLTLNITKNDVIYSTAQITFAYGVQALFIALFNGLEYIISQDFEEHNKIINQLKPTILFSVPFVIKKIFSEKINYRLNKVVSAGESITNKIRGLVRRNNGNEVLNSLGCTETLTSFISEVQYDSMLSEGSETGTYLGRMISGVDYCITNDKGEACNEQEVGVLNIKTQTVRSGLDRHGYFCTNDLVYIDEFENFYYVGRKNQVIKSAGQWVPMHEIEEIINGIQGVKDCLVYLGSCDYDLSVPVADVMVKNLDISKPIKLEKEIIAKCQGLLSRHMIPRKINFVESMQYTFTGKKMRLKGVVS